MFWKLKVKPRVAARTCCCQNMTQICQITHCSLCYALKQSYWVPHKKANLKEICRLENDLYKIAIGRILATHAQNYQIHSTHRVTRGNLYAKILNEKTLSIIGNKMVYSAKVGFSRLLLCTL